MDREIIRAMAKAERMMDSGELPYVWAPSAKGIMERLACTSEIMVEFDLVSGQRVNSMIREAIIDFNIKQMLDRLGDIADNIGLDPNFDFRKMMEDNDDDNT
jgi:hypothetical protein